MTLSKISKFLFLFIIAAALLSSCTKEEISVDDYTLDNTHNSNDSIPDNYSDDDDDCDDHDDLYELTDCLDFVFPITVIFPDTTESTFLDENKLEDALEDWYDANPDSSSLPVLAYPLEVILDDDSRITINSFEELQAAVIECEVRDFMDDYVSTDCFTVTWPISFVLPDSTSHSVNNVEEALSIFLPFYTEHPMADEPDLIFPIEVTMNNGTLVTVNTYGILDDLEDSCDD